MKRILLLLVLFLAATAFSQNVNDYEYVIVPTKFSFLKADDKYRLNTNSRLLLQKYGFKSVFPSDSIPSEIANNNCKKLYFDIIEDNKFLITKIKIVLKDCREKLLFESDYGTSKEKEFEIAYNKALREAGKSFDKLNYKYNGKNNSSITQEPSKTIVSETDSETFYFAQPTANGFQVVDNNPKVIMKLYTTSQKNVFLGTKGVINGVLISKENQWFFEYYEGGKLVSESWNLKF
ncbi:MAG: hypothetical protein ACOVNM_04925 [Flavobacterium sp.]|jgi:hypothetical protein